MGLFSLAVYGSDCSEWVQLRKPGFVLMDHGVEMLHV